MARTRKASRSASSPPSRPLDALAGATLLVGAIAGLGLLGVARLSYVAASWRGLFGVASLSIAVGLLVAGIGLLRSRGSDPFRLPWGRALAAEAALAAALALLASGFPTAPPGKSGAGGLVGWALATAARKAIGPLPAVLAWLAVGTLGLLAASGLGLRQLAGNLARLADWLAEETAEAKPESRTTKPRTGSGTAADRAGKKGKSRAKASRSDRASRSAPPVIRTAAPAKRKAPRKRAGADGSLPALNLLGADRTGRIQKAALRAMAEKIERTLLSFGVPAKVMEIERGPAVTRFGLQPGTIEKGGRSTRVTVARIKALKDDLALALETHSLRIEAPVPGRPVVGVEIPNPETSDVGLKGLLDNPVFRRSSRKSMLSVALGRDVSGQAVVADLAAMPHLLIAGSTGSGKSVCLHALITSLLFQNTPDALSLILVDPKRVEFGRYKRLPHLVGPVVTEIPEVIAALRWAMSEMDLRYRRFAERGVRDWATFNARSPAGEAPLPALVVVIDELADPMLSAAEETEPLLMRLAQLGRSTAIHLVVATQRPSTDVLTGVIKANFPARIAFAVASNTDSRVILDTPGAETLLGRGDMLFRAPDARRPQRAQGTFVSDEEIDRLVEFWVASPWPTPSGPPPWSDMVRPLDAEERLYHKAVELAEEVGPVHASLLQHRLRIGYRRARQLLDRLEEEGLAGHHEIDEPTSDPAEDLDWVDDEYEGA